MTFGSLRASRRSVDPLTEEEVSVLRAVAATARAARSERATHIAMEAERFLADAGATEERNP
jgi:hypothetical protein